MMKRFGIIIAALTLYGGAAFSQGMLEAYRFGQTELQGTARYMSMGGAFGALGGDISVMSKNPAGLAVYRTSEAVATMSLALTNAKTDWLGMSMNKNKTKFDFDNIAYVGYFPTGQDEGVIGWNAGFAYNRLKNFQRHYSMSSGGGLDTSLSDYVAERAYGNHKDALLGTSDYNPYDVLDSDWLSVLGYDAGFMEAYSKDPQSYYSSFNDRGPNDPGNYYAINDAILDVRETGSIDKYDFSFGLNISDAVLLGATFSVTDINYDMSSTYKEFFEYNNKLYLNNGLSTKGSGYTVNAGVIVRPVDFLRLGVAYNSPTWYKMTDYYYGDAGTYLDWEENGELMYREWDVSTPDNPYTDYEYRSPDKWIFSVAGIIGQSALISLDYEMTNYASMKMYDYRGDVTKYYSDTNADIKDNFKRGSTIRLGAEVRVTPQFSVRAGGNFTESPVKDNLKGGEMEVFVAGTIPHYTVDKGSSSYTVGFGYRFTPQFYMDMACVLTSYKEDVYAFSSIPDAAVWAQAASLKTNRTRMALTLGYKF